MATVEERLAALEAREEIRDGDMAEIKSDVKLLLASQNKQKGVYAVIGVAFSAIGAIVASVVTYVLKGGHG